GHRACRYASPMTPPESRPPGEAAGALRLVVIAEDPLAREVFRERLLDDPQTEVVAAVRGVEDLAAALAREPADAAVWDLGVRADVALATAPEILGEISAVLALAMDGQAAADALEAGARAAIARDRDGAAIAAAVRAMLLGFEVLDPRIEPADPVERRRRPPSDELTPREREVLALLVEGLSNRAIGERLGISEHTAKFHVTAVMQKLGAQTRTEAVVKAARLGLVTL
ncbi:MAG TPA: response regulator transcription factor, partial [Myxococcaceae bacterium]|nr:response regulator transcription factor [Myxococcaceae bacterium]